MSLYYCRHCGQRQDNDWVPCAQDQRYALELICEDHLVDEELA